MRLIDADKLIEELEDWYKQCGGTTNQRDWIIQDVISSAMDTVNEAETIDAEPVRHGEWVHVEDDEYLCSACKIEFTIEDFDSFVTNYCPNCGAKMHVKDTNVPTK